MDIRVSNIAERTKANGPGTRFCTWVQGCVGLECPGCWNAITHDPNGGKKMDTLVIAELICRSRSSIAGVSFTGGEPLQQIDAVLDIMSRVRELWEDCSFVIFTGFSLDEIREMDRGREVFELADMMVTGRFDRTRLTNDPSRWLSSENQELWFRQGGLISPDVKNECPVEIRVDKEGVANVSGFPTPQIISSIRRMGHDQLRGQEVEFLESNK